MRDMCCANTATLPRSFHYIYIESAAFAAPVTQISHRRLFRRLVAFCAPRVVYCRCHLWCGRSWAVGVSASRCRPRHGVGELVRRCATPRSLPRLLSLLYCTRYYLLSLPRPLLAGTRVVRRAPSFSPTEIKVDLVVPIVCVPDWLVYGARPLPTGEGG